MKSLLNKMFSDAIVKYDEAIMHYALEHIKNYVINHKFEVGCDKKYNYQKCYQTITTNRAYYLDSMNNALSTKYDS